jgi:hypothetical protein
LDRLPWRKEKFWSEVAQAELGVTNARTENLLCRGKPPSGQEGRLINHGEDRASDEVPSRIEVEGIDRLNVEDV